MCICKDCLAQPVSTPQPDFREIGLQIWEAQHHQSTSLQAAKKAVPILEKFFGTLTCELADAREEIARLREERYQAFKERSKAHESLQAEADIANKDYQSYKEQKQRAEQAEAEAKRQEQARHSTRDQLEREIKARCEAESECDRLKKELEQARQKTAKEIAEEIRGHARFRSDITVPEEFNRLANELERRFAAKEE
jgi:chromosome segregation ATPase